MKTINENTNNTYIINKSKFITFLYKVNNIDEINNYLKAIKEEYKDATHVCYGYIIDNKEKFSDDAEPNGTAGMPILNVLKKNELTNIICVVVRYFGGIKLGAGGLTRAYTKSVTECLEKTKLKEIQEGYLIELTFNYENNKIIDLLLKDEIILEKNFNDQITYKVIINQDPNFYKKLELAAIHISILDNIKY